jgi:hypothetical protein
MKINGWISSLVVAGLITAGAARAETQGVDENLEQLEQSLQQLKDSNQETQAVKSSFKWVELERFQDGIWRAMALDPTPIAPVPVNQVPKNLFAAELNQDLSHQLEELKKSPLPKDLRAQFEFDQYIELAGKIVEMRQSRQFPQARAIAKRGTLDTAYQGLIKKIAQNADSQWAVKQVQSPEVQQMTTLVQTIKEQLHQQTRDTQKKEVFGNGNQFVWYAIAAMFGFLMGIAGYRMNPDFFSKFLDQGSTAPTATTHTASGAPKLDYARWLKEFEEILSRLKSTQLTHERRIEDIVHNSEKVSQHALALYADARIKNEANLEFRMSTLLREIQHTFEQSQKLQAGDRAHVNLMLEHCLKLCDGIETNSILFDRNKLVEPPNMRVSA